MCPATYTADLRWKFPSTTRAAHHRDSVRPAAARLGRRPRPRGEETASRACCASVDGSVLSMDVDRQIFDSLPDGRILRHAIEERLCIGGVPAGEAIKVLISSAAAEANLNDVGWFELGNLSLHGLRVQRAFEPTAGSSLEASPAVFADVIVGGLPRTGTTLLHELLNGCQDLCAPLSWQVQFPIADEVTDGARAAAIQSSTDRYDAAKELMPRLAQMHPLEPLGTEECTHLLQHSLVSMQMLMMFRMPSYFDWFYCQDLGPPYRLWDRQLNTIRRESPCSLVLKSPLHFAGYQSLLTSHPPRLLIHIRRSLRQAIDSLLQMVEVLRGLFSKNVPDRAAMVGEWTIYLEALLDRATRVLRSNPVRLVLVDYDDLVHRPNLVLTDICARLDIETPSPLWINSVTSGLHDKHAYEHRSFGVLLDPLMERLGKFEHGEFA